MTTTIRKVETDYYKEQVSEKISLATKHGMYKTARQGQAVSKVAFGYKISEDKTLVIDEKAAGVVRKIYSLAEQGYGARKISQFLRELEVPTPTEHRKGLENSTCIWSTSTILQILRNKVFVGVYMYGVHSFDGQIMEIEDNHTPIITREQYERVQEQLNIRINNSIRERGKRNNEKG